MVFYTTGWGFESLPAGQNTEINMEIVLLILAVAVLWMVAGSVYAFNTMEWDKDPWWGDVLMWPIMLIEWVSRKIR